MPRVVFLGTSAFGADVLRRLCGEPGIDIVAVVTQPDRPSGRGQRPGSPPVAAAAGELGLRLVQTDRASAEPVDADVGAVVAFGQMVRQPLLGAYPLYNLHPSLLPRWRGAAPVERALMAGDHETGVCVIELTAELDAGPIHGCARFEVGPEDDAGRVGPGRSSSGRRSWPRRCAAGRTARSSPPSASPTRTRSSLATAVSTGPEPPPMPPTSCERSRRTSARAASSTAQPVTVWRARAGPGGGDPGAIAPPLRIALRRGCARGARAPAGGPAADGRRRLPARAPASAGAGGMSARAVACEVVRRTFEEDAYTDRAFRAEAERAELDDRDRRLAMRLAFGTVQRVRTLDHALETLAGRPADELQPTLRAALRVGAYQLLFAEGVPPHAAVNETVELCKRVAGRPHGGPRQRRAAQDRRRGGGLGGGPSRSPCGTRTRTGSSRSGRRCSARPTPRR